jgi:hypothetical protein
LLLTISAAPPAEAPADRGEAQSEAAQSRQPESEKGR